MTFVADEFDWADIPWLDTIEQVIFALEMMDCALKMVHFVFKMMNFVGPPRRDVLRNPWRFR